MVPIEQGLNLDGACVVWGCLVKFETLTEAIGRRVFALSPQPVWLACVFAWLIQRARLCEVEVEVGGGEENRSGEGGPPSTSATLSSHRF